MTALALRDPGVRARLTCPVTLQGADGAPLVVRRGTACFARRTAQGWDVEVPTQAVGSAYSRAVFAPAFAVAARGEAPLAAVRAREAFVPAAAGPLFAHVPVPSDVRATSQRSCALAAVAAAMAAVCPERLQQAVRVEGRDVIAITTWEEEGAGRLQPRIWRVARSVVRPCSALWFEMLSKAMAVRGWPTRTTMSHARLCPGGRCDDYLQALCARPATALLVDVGCPASVCTLTRAALRADVAAGPNWGLDPALAAALAATDNPLAGGKPLVPQLSAAGLSDHDAAAVAQHVAAWCVAMRSPDLPATPVERLLGMLMAQRLAARLPVCLSTCPRLEPLDGWRRALADLRQRGRCLDYGQATRERRASAGLLGEHAYAVLAVAGDQVRLREPGGRLGRSGTGDRARACSAPEFWLSMRDVVRVTAAYYFVHQQ